MSAQSQGGSSGNDANDDHVDDSDVDNDIETGATTAIVPKGRSSNGATPYALLQPLVPPSTKMAATTQYSHKGSPVAKERDNASHHLYSAERADVSGGGSGGGGDGGREQQHYQHHQQYQHQTPQQQARMLQTFQCALACVGVSFSHSPWWLYGLQACGVGSQAWVLYMSVKAESGYFMNRESTSNFQQQTFWLVEVLILALPTMFLWHLTRWSSERREVKEVVIRNNLALLKGWMVFMSFFANVGIAATGGFFLGSAEQFLYRFIVLLPSSLVLLLCFGYSTEWARRLPTIDTVDELDDKVCAYQAATAAIISKLNRGFILPNALLLFFWTADTFWVLVDYLHGENFDDQLSHTENIIGEGLLVAFALVHFAALLLPPAHHTSNVNAFVARLDRQFCKAGGAATGALLWLTRQKLGWKVFAVVVSPEFLCRVCYVAGLAGVTALARAI